MKWVLHGKLRKNALKGSAKNFTGKKNRSSAKYMGSTFYSSARLLRCICKQMRRSGRLPAAMGGYIWL